MAVLKRLAAATNTELAVRRNGTTGYFIDLVNQIGAGAATVDIRLGKNVRAIRRERNSVEQATRVFPRGNPESNIHPSMAGARWKVTAMDITGTILTLSDPVNAAHAGPIQYDNQLNGLWLQTPRGDRIQVTASVAATQQVTVGAAPPSVFRRLRMTVPTESEDGLATFIETRRPSTVPIPV